MSEASETSSTNTSVNKKIDKTRQDNQSSPPKRFSTVSPQQAALRYPREDTMHWFESDSSLDWYEKLLGFDRKSLEGKTVLDLGTSPTDRLAKDVKAAGIHATVVGLSPDLRRLIPNELQEGAPQKDEWDRLGVAAIAQQMPFKDHSFDVILGAYSVTWRAATYPEQVHAWVNEIGRVLKPGGEARVGPSYSDRKTAMGEDFVNLKEYAKEAGLEIQITEDNIVLKKPQMVSEEKNAA